MFETIQYHQTPSIDRSNLSLCICSSRTLIRSALELRKLAATTIESDLILCGCAKAYLRGTGQNIDRLEQWELDLIGTYYQQITDLFPPVVSLRLNEIGSVIRAYIDLNPEN